MTPVRWLPIGLVAACLVLLPIGRAVELAVAVMAVFGVVLVARRGRALLEYPGMRAYTVLFLLFWVPLLVALPGAVEIGASARAALAMVRLYFAGIYLIHVMGDDGDRERVLQLSAVVLLFWIVDAFVQVARGTDLFGFGHPPDRINGIFGEGQLKLGMTLGVCSALLFDVARRRWPALAQVAVFIAAALIVFLGGSRSGWIMFGVVVAGYIGWATAARGHFPKRIAALAIVAAVGAGTVAYHVSPGFAERVQLSMQVLKGDAASVDAALSGRLWIWRVCSRMVAERPLTGVGPRGFRYAYTAYADPGDPFIDDTRDEGARHAHNHVLEVLTETGVVGAVALLAFYALLIRGWRQAPPARRVVALPFALALLAVLFPLNSNNALYSSYWSQFIWWLVALHCAALTGTANPRASQA